MANVALPSPTIALEEDVLASKIRARIAEYVGVDVEHLDDESDLNEDFGLDLLEVMELLTLLEDTFLDGKPTNDPNEIEVVRHFIRHIEQHRSL